MHRHVIPADADLEKILYATEREIAILAKEMEETVPVIHLDGEGRMHISPARPAVGEICFVRIERNPLFFLPAAFTLDGKGSPEELMEMAMRQVRERSAYLSVVAGVRFPVEGLSHHLRNFWDMRSIWSGLARKLPGLGIARSYGPDGEANGVEIGQLILFRNAYHPRLVAEITGWLHGTALQHISKEIGISTAPAFPGKSPFAADPDAVRSLTDAVDNELKKLAGMDEEISPINLILGMLDPKAVQRIIGEIDFEIGLQSFPHIGIPRLFAITTHEKPFRVTVAVQELEAALDRESLTSGVDFYHVDVQEVEVGKVMLSALFGIPLVMDADPADVARNIGHVIRMFVKISAARILYLARLAAGIGDIK